MLLADNPGLLTLEGTNTWVLRGPGSTQVLVPSSVSKPGLSASSTEAVSVTARNLPYAGWVGARP
ncbi:hypothetical protein JHV675_54640 [Mycobacterium avium subsp. hominissuis]